MSKLNKIVISMGFATGSPQNKNESWFSRVGTYFGCTSVDAIERLRKEAYSLDDDICADWVFRIEENGIGLSMIETNKIELFVIKRIAREFGDF